eukprot:Seg2672.5 transcript_id=Seg2672.5/GoldUCD/mRNA.D3Y31 product="Synaptic vesicle 2-related protein" protein_id=Seg2672.5/GoldUCD/D3Y31
MDVGKDHCEEIPVEEAISRIGIGKAQYLLILLCAGGYLASCSEMLVFVFSQVPIHNKWNIGNDEFCWLPFTKSLAGVVGGFLFGLWSDKQGRQKPFIISIGISAIFGLASAFAPSFWIFVLLRSMVSFGIGGIFAVDFVLLLEFLPVEHRGQFMVTITFCGALGVAYTAGLAWILIETNHWQLFLLLCVIPIFAVFIARIFINAESPRFLLSVGKHNKAMEILERMANQNKKDGILEGVKIVTSEKEKPSQFFNLFQRSHIIQTIQLSAIWFLQSTGYWGVTVFFPKYLTKFGAPVYFDIFVCICAELPGLFLVILMIDNPRFGRIFTLRCFSFGSIISLMLSAFLQTEIAISVLAVITYFFMVPIYSVLETYTPELYPTQLRSMMMSWINIVIAIPGMTTAFLGATIVSSTINWLYPLVWGLVFVFQLLIAFTLSKETLLMSLEKTSIKNEDNVMKNETQTIN